MLLEVALFLGGMAALVYGAARPVTAAGDLALYYASRRFSSV